MFNVRSAVIVAHFAFAVSAGGLVKRDLAVLAPPCELVPNGAYFWQNTLLDQYVQAGRVCASAKTNATVFPTTYSTTASNVQRDPLFTSAISLFNTLHNDCESYKTDGYGQYLNVILNMWRFARTDMPNALEAINQSASQKSFSTMIAQLNQLATIAQTYANNVDAAIAATNKFQQSLAAQQGTIGSLAGQSQARLSQSQACQARVGSNPPTSTSYVNSWNANFAGLTAAYSMLSSNLTSLQVSGAPADVFNQAKSIFTNMANKFQTESNNLQQNPPASFDSYMATVSIAALKSQWQDISQKARNQVWPFFRQHENYYIGNSLKVLKLMDKQDATPDALNFKKRDNSLMDTVLGDCQSFQPVRTPIIATAMDPPGPNTLVTVFDSPNFTGQSTIVYGSEYVCYPVSDDLRVAMTSWTLNNKTDFIRVFTGTDCSSGTYIDFNSVVSTIDPQWNDQVRSFFVWN